MKTFFKWLFYAISTIIALTIGVFFSYVTPAYEKVIVTSSEVRRINVDNNALTSGSVTEDRYFNFVTSYADPNKTFALRNSINYWHFKFEVTDLQAKVSNIIANKNVALIKYYGFNIPNVLELYPNLLTIKVVDPSSETPWPILFWLGIFVSFVLWLFLLGITHALLAKDRNK